MEQAVFLLLPVIFTLLNSLLKWVFWATHLGLNIGWGEQVDDDDDNDAFEMLCYHDNLWWACFSSSVLSDCSVFITALEVKFQLWPPLFWLNKQKMRRQKRWFDWSIAVHSVAYDTQKASLLSWIGTWLRCHRYCVYMCFCHKNNEKLL